MEFFNEVAKIVSENWQYFLQGIGYTMLIAMVSTILGLVIGLIIGIIRTIPKSKHAVVRGIMSVVNFIISVYVEVFRGTPMMVQAMVIYWGYAFMNDGATLPIIPAGIFIVAINTGAYMAEIVRGGIISIDKGQFEGAYSVGMTHWQAMFHVVVPQVMRNILPSISNEFVINIKDTSVLNVIGVTELYFFTAKVSKMTWAIFETILVACFCYFVLTFAVTRILKVIEKKLNGSDSYTICGSQSDPEAEIHIRKENA